MLICLCIFEEFKVFSAVFVLCIYDQFFLEVTAITYVTLFPIPPPSP